ncbi:MAG: dienelactone hydrolase family protein [Ardenticatenaceae bacterium]|nr:dienelactone hydrolase family protein [Ardenticatenaceae bacterium]
MNPKPQLIETGEAFTKAGLIHRVSQPEGTGPWPTAVLLHGHAGNEDVMWVFARTLPQNWLLVAPRAIHDGGADGGYSWYPRQLDVWPTLSAFDEAVTAVTHLIHSLPALYNADPHRIYLMGFSQGAALAYATAIRQPGLVQGIAGLVGFVPKQTETALETSPLQDLPIFMAVSTQDERIPTKYARQGAKIIKTADAQLEYHEYDTGHKLNAQGMRDLAAWWGKR